MLDQIIKEIKNITFSLPKKLRIYKQLLEKKHLLLSCFFFSLLKEEIAIEDEKKKCIILILELVRMTVAIHCKLSEKESQYSSKQLILAGDHYFSQALCRIPLIKDEKIEQMIFNSITKVTKSDVLLGIWTKKKSLNLKNYKKFCSKRDGALFTLALELVFVLTKTHYQQQTIQKLGQQMGYLINIHNEMDEWEKKGKDYFKNDFVTFPILVNQLNKNKKIFKQIKNIFNKKTSNLNVNTNNDLLIQKCENLIKNEKKILENLLYSSSLPNHFYLVIDSFFKNKQRKKYL